MAWWVGSLICATHILTLPACLPRVVGQLPATYRHLLPLQLRWCCVGCALGLYWRRSCMRGPSVSVAVTFTVHALRAFLPGAVPSHESSVHAPASLPPRIHLPLSIPQPLLMTFLPHSLSPSIPYLTTTRMKHNTHPARAAGCFPPKLPRQRPVHWYWENGLAPPPWMVARAPESKGLGKLFKWGSSRSITGVSAEGMRQRKGKGEEDGGGLIGHADSHKSLGKDSEALSVVVAGGRTHSVAVPSGMLSGMSMASIPRTVSVASSGAGLITAAALGLPAPPPPLAPMVVTAELARLDTLKSREQQPSNSNGAAAAGGAGNGSGNGNGGGGSREGSQLQVGGVDGAKADERPASASSAGKGGAGASGKSAGDSGRGGADVKEGRASPLPGEVPDAPAA